MEHTMHLHDEPFKKIQQGIKKVEGRINDEKRKRLRVGDKIFFVSRISGERLIVEITKLETYKNFEEMFNKTKKTLWTDKEITKEKFLSSFYKYYNKDDERKYGVVAIYFEL